MYWGIEVLKLNPRIEVLKGENQVVLCKKTVYLLKTVQSIKCE